MGAPLSAWLVFPLVLGGAMGAGFALMPHLGPPLTVALCEGTAAIVILVCERRWPFRAEWNRSHGDLRTDILHVLVSGIGVTNLVKPLATAAGVALAGWLSGLLGAGLWPGQWPLPAQLALALVAVELPQYWLHRWQHEHDFLWRFHAVHHSAPRLYWLNAARFHPVDLALLYAVGYVPLVAVGAGAELIAHFALFDAVFGMLQHCNVEIRLGPLNRVFSMAEPHRWHHSRTLAEANTNYGSNLIVWDLVFGTFFLPSGRRPPQNIGISDMPDFPAGYLAQLASPFSWKRLARDGLARP